MMASETILVADDDRIVVQLLTNWLSSDEVRVIGVADAMQATMAVRRSPPSAILLDIMMPGGTGFEFVKRLRSNIKLNSTPVIAMSASDDPELSRKVQVLGANAFLRKPFQMHEVAATLERLLTRPGHPVSQDPSVWRRLMMSFAVEFREQGSRAPKAPSTKQSDIKAASAAAQVWTESRNVIFERMSAIDGAVTALRGAKLTEEIRQKAIVEAYRLVGSLGMLGMTEATRFAREIERLFGDQAAFGPGTSRQLYNFAASLRQILEGGLEEPGGKVIR